MWQVATDFQSVLLAFYQPFLGSLPQPSLLPNTLSCSPRGAGHLKTDLPKEVASKETIHDRYKGLSEVEWAVQDAKDRISSSKAYICA